MASRSGDTVSEESASITTMTDDDLSFAIINTLVCYWHLDNPRSRQGFKDFTWKGAALVPLIEEWLERNPAAVDPLIYAYGSGPGTLAGDDDL